MPKYEFQTDPSKKKHKSITETKVATPDKTFDLPSFSKSKSIISNDSIDTKHNTKLGRPRKNKVYSTIRIQRRSVHRINALQNTLEYETQDDIITFLLDRLENLLEPEQQTMYNMYMKTYEARDHKSK